MRGRHIGSGRNARAARPQSPHSASLHAGYAGPVNLNDYALICAPTRARRYAIIWAYGGREIGFSLNRTWWFDLNSGRKDFFFEKKKQKTFNLPRPRSKSSLSLGS
jgi:hypothetical protein